MSIDAGLGPRRDGDAVETRPSAAEDLARLRHLLLHGERDQLRELARRLDDPEVRAAEASAVLPEAVRLAVARGPGLAVTIAPVVEEAIHESVRHDPARLVNAIFPVMGPAIRRSIAATLRDMVQSLNQVLESSVSWRGLLWRLEARRTGRPFAEVVLLHTLVYQVEQVFLIHARTGLLLQHVVAASATSPDPQVVSGMLTAIQDFVNDSFNAGVPGALETMHVGDRTVWIETGPHAYLAGIVRGQAPTEFRSALQDALARIHAGHALLLERFEGQAAPFDACRPLLESCLHAKYAGRQTGGVSRPLVVVLALAVMLLGLWAFLSLRSSRRWNQFVERLRAEPGLVLVTADRRAGRFHVSGLRDPLAADPGRLQAEAGYAPGEVTARWDTYYAADPAFVVARATALLSPPPTATLGFDDGALTVAGTAPRVWVTDTLRLARFVPGVTAVRSDALRIQEVVDADVIAETVGLHAVFFAAGSDRLDAGQRPALTALSASLQALLGAARAAAVTVAIEVIGSTDETGTETANVRLAARRAEAVVAALVAEGFDRRLFAVTAGPVTGPSPGEDQRARKRRVHLRVRLTPSAEAGESGR